MKKKGMISLILSAFLLTGMLTLLGACDSGEGDQTSNTVDQDRTGGTIASRFDGTWLALYGSKDVMIVSGNSVEVYSYDKEEERYITSLELMEKNYDTKIDYEIELNDNVVTQSVTLNGQTQIITWTMTLIDDMITMKVKKDDRELSSTYEWARINAPITELKQLKLKGGYWYSEDKEYSFFLSEDNYDARIEQKSDGVMLLAPSGISLFSYDYMVWATIENYDNSVCILLTYTLDGDTLTIRGLDKITAGIFGGEEFPVSELTFIYYGEDPIE